MKKTVLFLVTSLILVSSVLADVKTYKKVKLNGSNNYISVLAETETLVLWGISRGKMTSYLEITGNFPKKTKVKVYGATVKKSVSQALRRRRKHYPISLLTQRRLSAKHSQCLDISVEGSEPDEESLLDVNDYPAIDSPVCDEIGQDVLAQMATQMSETFGGGWTAGNACAYVLSIAGDVWLDPEEWCDNLSPEEIEVLEPFGLDCEEDCDDCEPPLPARSAAASYGRSFNHKGLFRKDSCNKKASKYLVLITLNFSDVEFDGTSTDFDINVRINEFKRRKGKESALKPKSEGRYSPRPIMMMNWLGGTCGNKIDIVKWRKLKPKKVTSLNVYSLLAYKDMVLNLALVDSALSRGKGTAELYNGRDSYGVCFKLVRKRQNKNGYPY